MKAGYLFAIEIAEKIFTQLEGELDYFSGSWDHRFRDKRETFSLNSDML